MVKSTSRLRLHPFPTLRTPFLTPHLTRAIVTPLPLPSPPRLHLLTRHRRRHSHPHSAVPRVISIAHFIAHHSKQQCHCQYHTDSDSQTEAAKSPGTVAEADTLTGAGSAPHASSTYTTHPSPTDHRRTAMSWWLPVVGGLLLVYSIASAYFLRHPLKSLHVNNVKRQGVNGTTTDSSSSSSASSSSEHYDRRRRAVNLVASIHTAAHRGGALERPENTISAFKHSRQVGMDLLELDVHMTKDGEVVVWHDLTVDRVAANGERGRVKDFAYNSLPRLHPHPLLPPPFHLPGLTLQMNYDPATGDTLDEWSRAPRLEDVFQHFPDAFINVDVKHHHCPELVEKVATLIEKYDRVERTIWGSTNETTCNWAYQRNPYIPLFFTPKRLAFLLFTYLTGLLPFVPLRESALEVPLFTSAAHKRLAAPGLRHPLSGESMRARVLRTVIRGYSYLISRPSLVKHLQSRGILVCYWVLNEESEFEEALPLDAAIMTDDPTRLRRFLEAQGKWKGKDKAKDVVEENEPSHSSNGHGRHDEGHPGSDHLSKGHPNTARWFSQRHARKALVGVHENPGPSKRKRRINPSTGIGRWFDHRELAISISFLVMLLLAALSTLLVPVSATSGPWKLLGQDDDNFTIWVGLLIIALLIIIYFLLSYWFQHRLLLGEIPLAIALGIAIAQSGFAKPDQLIVDDSAVDEVVVSDGSLDTKYRFLRLVTVIMISIQLMSSGLHTSATYLKRRGSWIGLASMLGPVLILMTLINSALLYAFFHDRLRWWECFTVGAATSPTDPVLAAAIMRGRFARSQLSTTVRELLSFESSCNDGLALPLVALGLELLNPAYSTGESIGVWIYEACIWEVALPVVVGVCIGWLSSWALHYCISEELANHDVLFPFPIALTIMLMSSMELLGCNAFISIIAAATTIAFILAKRSYRVYGVEELSVVAESLDLTVSVGFFFVLATFFSFTSWSALGYGRLIGWGVLTFLLRRLPATLLMYGIGGLPTIHSWSEATFCGWFAPVGSASTFYAIVVMAKFDEYVQKEVSENGEASITRHRAQSPMVAFHLILWLIFMSGIVHGLLGPAWAHLLRSIQSPIYEEDEEKRKEEKERDRERRRGREEQFARSDAPHEHATDDKQAPPPNTNQATHAQNIGLVREASARSDEERDGNDEPAQTSNDEEQRGIKYPSIPMSILNRV